MTQFSPLKVAFARNHPEELATYLSGRTHDELLQGLAGMPADAGAAVTARLPDAMLVKLLATQSDEVVSSWVSQASLDDALTLVLHLDERRRAGILASVPIRHMRRTLERLVVYPQRTVGALVDPTVVRLTASTSLHEGIMMLRAGGEEPAWIWIVDGDGRYLGLLDFGKALVARSDQHPVGELAIRLEPLRAETALAAARDLSDWLKHPELPVVDHLNHLLGALSRQRLMDALAQETPTEYGILDGVTTLTNQYFRVLGMCLDDLLGLRNS
jgi:Mg/Co/Ni transporter MgtE